MHRSTLDPGFSGLCHLSKLDTKQRKKVLTSCPNELIKSLSEVCENCINGNLPLSNKLKNELQPHKEYIRLIAKKKLPLVKKRQIAIQKGGFVPILLKFALPIIASYIASKASK